MSKSCIRFAATVPGTGPAVHVRPRQTFRIAQAPDPAATAHDTLTNAPNNWVITDAGPV